MWGRGDEQNCKQRENPFPAGVTPPDPCGDPPVFPSTGGSQGAHTGDVKSPKDPALCKGDGDALFFRQNLRQVPDGDAVHKGG